MYTEEFFTRFLGLFVNNRRLKVSYCYNDESSLFLFLCSANKSYGQRAPLLLYCIVTMTNNPYLSFSALPTALVDNADPTDIRLIGRRRNALLTSPPYTPDVDRDS